MKLYGLERSPPTHAVSMTLSILGIEDYDLEIVRSDRMDDIARDFGAKFDRRQHVPILIDGHHKSNNAASIMIHLVETYGGKSHFLYPADRPEVRAKIDQRLDYFSTSLWTIAYRAFSPFIYGDGLERDRDVVDGLANVLGTVESWIRDGSFICDTKHVTLADIAFLAVFDALRNFGSLIGLDFDGGSRFKRLIKWADRTRGVVIDYDPHGLTISRGYVLKHQQRYRDIDRGIKTVTKVTRSSSWRLRDLDLSSSDDEFRLTRKIKKAMQ